MHAFAMALQLGVALGASGSATGTNQPPGSIPEVCAPRPEPTSDGRVEGRIVSRSGGPRGGVRVEAVVSKPDARFSTTSGADGRYALGNLPTERDLSLLFVASDKGPSTSCEVRVETGRTPTINVVLDLPSDFSPDAGVVDDGVGCQGRPSWKSPGIFQIIPAGESEARWGKDPLDRPKEPSAQLDVRARDIESVAWQRDRAIVRLSPPAAEAARAFWTANEERIVLFTVEGVPALRVQVSSFPGFADAWRTNSIDFLQVPADMLPGRLCDILRPALLPSGQ